MKNKNLLRSLKYNILKQRTNHIKKLEINISCLTDNRILKDRFPYKNGLLSLAENEEGSNT